MNDSMNLINENKDNADWKITHQEHNRTIYVLEDKSITKDSLKLCKDFTQVRKFTAIFKQVKYEKIKDFMGDFGKWVTNDMLKSQGGPMSWMNN